MYFVVSLKRMVEDDLVERRLRCRKCMRTGTVVWQVAQPGHPGGRVLLSLTQGFHKRMRLPLNANPEIVCDCGMAQPD